MIQPCSRSAWRKGLSGAAHPLRMRGVASKSPRWLPSFWLPRGGPAHQSVESRRGDSMQVGSVVGGRYRLISLLVEGGMGAVWRAEHLELGALIAVKLLDRQLAASAEGVARFRREARAAANLRSVHV